MPRTSTGTVQSTFRWLFHPAVRVPVQAAQRHLQAARPGSQGVSTRWSGRCVDIDPIRTHVHPDWVAAARRNPRAFGKDPCTSRIESMATGGVARGGWSRSGGCQQPLIPFSGRKDEVNDLHLFHPVPISDHG